MSAHTQIQAAAAPFLETGETIEVALKAGVGRVSVKKQVATAAVSTVLSLGTVTMMARPAYRALALTNKRLLVLETSSGLGRAQKKLVGELPREVMRVERRRSLVNAVYDLVNTQGSGQAVRVTCPLWSRKAGARLSAVLNASASAPPA